MTTVEDEIKAKAEAAYAIETASGSAIIQAIRDHFGDRHAKMIWQVAWLDGYKSGLKLAQSFIRGDGNGRL